MKKTLTRTQRLIRIVEILNSGRKCDIATLVDEFGVSRRTALRDVHVLREAGMICSYDPDSGSYILKNSFHLKPLSLTMDECVALLMITRKIVSNRVLPAHQSLESAFMKVEAAIPNRIQKECGAVIANLDFQWPRIVDAGPFSDVIFQTVTSISRRNKINIRYDCPNDKQEIATTIRPYRVVFRERGWYLIGYSERHRQVRIFQVERIVKLLETSSNFRMVTDFSLADFFGNAWDVVRGDRTYHVEIVFGVMVAESIEGIIWHPTQQTRRRSNGSIVFEVDVDGIDEILWWILGYGDQAVVIQPEALRSKVARIAERTVRLYRLALTSPVNDDS